MPHIRTAWPSACEWLAFPPIHLCFRGITDWGVCWTKSYESRWLDPPDFQLLPLHNPSGTLPSLFEDPLPSYLTADSEMVFTCADCQ
eukprot:756202-Hanusia_phi.AAC.1